LSTLKIQIDNNNHFCSLLNEIIKSLCNISKLAVSSEIEFPKPSFEYFNEILCGLRIALESSSVVEKRVHSRQKYSYKIQNYTSWLKAYNCSTLLEEFVVPLDLSNIQSHLDITLITRDNRFYRSGKSSYIDNSLIELDTNNKNFACRAYMKEKRIDHCFVELRHNFLLVTSGKTTNTCEIYSVICNTWIMGPPMKDEISQNAVFVVNEKTVMLNRGNQRGRLNFSIFDFDEEFNGEWRDEVYTCSHDLRSKHIFGAICVSDSEYMLLGYIDTKLYRMTEQLRFNTNTNKIILKDLPSEVRKSLFHTPHISSIKRDKHYILTYSGGLYIFNRQKWIYILDFANKWCY